MNRPGVTGAVSERLQWEVADGTGALWRGWVLGSAEWRARADEGRPVALLAGGPLDAPDVLPAGGMVCGWRERTGPEPWQWRMVPPSMRTVVRP